MEPEGVDEITGRNVLFGKNPEGVNKITGRGANPCIDERNKWNPEGVDENDVQFVSQN